MSTGVVFFSRNNNTRTAAQYLAAKYSAEIIELVELNGRKVLFGLIRSNIKASKGQLPELEGNPWEGVKELRKVYLMTPIWGGNMAPAVASFLQKANFKDKEALAVTLQADRKGKGSSKVHDIIKKYVVDSGGTFIGGYALHGAFPGKYGGKVYIEEQVDRFF